MQSVVSKSLFKIYKFLVLTKSFESFLGARSWTECIFPRTTDTQRGNSLHCTAENSIPIPNF